MARYNVKGKGTITLIVSGFWSMISTRNRPAQSIFCTQMINLRQLEAQVNFHMILKSHPAD